MSTIKVKQVAHVCILANDLNETAAFYRDVLGMNIVFNFLRDGNVFGFYLEAGGRPHVEVFLKPAAGFAETNQINHRCLEVEDITQAVEHIRGQDVDVTDKKHACDDTWQAWLKDPNGVKIELFEYTAKSAQFKGVIASPIGRAAPGVSDQLLRERVQRSTPESIA